VPDAKHDDSVCMNAIAEDVCARPKGHKQLSPLGGIIHTAAHAGKFQELLSTELYGSDGSFCSSWVLLNQEVVQTLYIGLRLR
jgi:hypothetical protein